MNFHISRWSPLRPQFSSSSLNSALNQPSPRSPSSSHRHDPTTGTNHDTVTSHHHHPTNTPSSVIIEVDGVDTSDDDLMKPKHHNGANDGADIDEDTESESDISADDVTQDSRDVLVQRLADLADKLSEGHVRTSSVEALHKQVDEMERVLRHGSRARSVSRHSRSSSRRTQGGRGARSLRPGSRPRSLQLAAAPGTGGNGSGTTNGELSPGRDALGIIGATPMSPSWFVSQFQRRPSMHFQERDREEMPPAAADMGREQYVSSAPLLDDLESSQEAPRTSQQQAKTPPIEHQSRQDSVRAADMSPPEISSEVAETVVMEAEKLCAEMATVIESLQSRRQESDHLHEILNHRNQLSHQRRLQQQQQQQQQQQYEHTRAQTETAAVIEDLEEVLADHEADLRHLKVELRAIEAQCMGYVPKGADPELEESIWRWRQDWAVLKDKFATTRKRPGWARGKGRRVISLPAASSLFVPSGGGDGEKSNSSVSGLTSPISALTSPRLLR